MVSKAVNRFLIFLELQFQFAAESSFLPRRATATNVELSPEKPDSTFALCRHSLKVDTPIHISARSQSGTRQEVIAHDRLAPVAARSIPGPDQHCHFEVAAVPADRVEFRG